MKTTEQDIKTLKDRLKKAETAKIQAETQLTVAQEQLQAVESEMQKEGVTPETIDSVIMELGANIDEDVTRLKEMIPDV